MINKLKILSALQWARQRGTVVILCLVCALLFMPVGCGTKASINDGDDENNCECENLPTTTAVVNEEDECKCKDELYYYVGYDSEKVILGDLLLNDRLLVSFDEKATKTEIVNYINQTCLFKPVNTDNVYDKYVFIVLRESKSCSLLKEIIQMLEKSPIVCYANLTFKGEKFVDTHDIVPDGHIRVGSFKSIFEVKVKDTNDLSDLNALSQDTNTDVLYQSAHPNWFYLRADKNSKGNAMQMGNYFYESGKFLFAGPCLICHDLKINQ